MSKKRVVFIGLFVFLIIATVITAVLVHFFVFPRTTIFQETGILPEEITGVNILREGYSDNISIHDDELIGVVADLMGGLSLTKAYRYEHKDSGSLPCYTYVLRTKDERTFAVRFYDTDKKIDLIKYDMDTQKAVGWEYTLESFGKQELDFFQTIVPENKWITEGESPPIQFAPDKALTPGSILDYDSK